MLTLIVVVLGSLIISACCSMTETVLYSVPLGHIERLRKDGRRAGDILHELRAQVDRPITAVLTLNTVVNTAGSAVAGALAANVLGSEYVGAFAALFTLLVLVFGEILPKTLGVAYPAPLSTVIAWPLRIVVQLFTPIIWLGGFLTRLVMPANGHPQATEDDIRAVVSLTRQAGHIEPYEERSIRNILSLDQQRVSEIMTPRTVIFSLPEDMTLEEATQNDHFWHYSRIPVYDDDNEDVVGLVTRRRVTQELTEGFRMRTLQELMEPIHFVLETQTLDKLLAGFLETRTHLFAVLDEYGGLAGVVSLEDVMEEILGREIVDETDTVADLRELARQRRKAVYQGKTEINQE